MCSARVSIIPIVFPDDDGYVLGSINSRVLFSQPGARGPGRSETRVSSGECLGRDGIASHHSSWPSQNRDESIAVVLECNIGKVMLDITPPYPWHGHPMSLGLTFMCIRRRNRRLKRTLVLVDVALREIPYSTVGVERTKWRLDPHTSLIFVYGTAFKDSCYDIVQYF